MNTDSIEARRTPIFILCGPAGSGKSSMAAHVTQTFGYIFLEGDLFHSPENIAKMSNGTPLNDDDRKAWLEDIRAAAQKEADKPTCNGVVVACSALKTKYRRLLADNNTHPVFFLFLKSSREELLNRMSRRGEHYMKPNMLESQINDLEMPNIDSNNEPNIYVIPTDGGLDKSRELVTKCINSALITTALGVTTQ